MRRRHARGPFTFALASVIPFALVLLQAGAAFAGDEDEARAAMVRGVAAFGRGDSESALLDYEKAKRLVPLANAPYRYAAEAHAALGHWVEAVQNLDGYLSKNPAVSDAAEVRERIAAIRAEHFPARARVVVDAPDPVVVVDGVTQPSADVLVLPPGRHRIEVSAKKRVAVVQDVKLVGDRETSLNFALPIVLASAPTQPEIPSAPVDSTETATPWRTVGWVGLGVAGATLLTTFIIDAAVLGPKLSDYRDAADRGDPRARELHTDATSLRTGVLIGYVGGGVLAIASTALVIFAPTTTVRTPASTGSTLTVRPGLAPGYAGVATALVF